MQSFLISLLAVCAAASPALPYLKTLDDRELTLTTTELLDFKLYVQYAGSAYCNGGNSVGDPIKCGENVCPEVESNGATTLATFNGDGTGISGFLGVDPAKELLIVAIRGTNNIRNWMANAAFVLIDCYGLPITNCRAHTGFQIALAEIYTPLNEAVAAAISAHPSYRLVLTGHSLGGAVATLAAAHFRKSDIPCDIYTFGSPRVGNSVFTDYVSAQPGREYRITHGSDPVPRLPPLEIGYRHTTPEYWLSGGDGKTLAYGVGDIKICEGNANVDCNGGTFGLDTDAHLNYFQYVSACGTDGLPWKRGMSDEELETLLNEWVAEDIAAVRSGRIQ